MRRAGSRRNNGSACSSRYRYHRPQGWPSWYHPPVRSKVKDRHDPVLTFTYGRSRGRCWCSQSAARPDASLVCFYICMYVSVAVCVLDALHALASSLVNQHQKEGRKDKGGEGDMPAISDGRQVWGRVDIQDSLCSSSYKTKLSPPPAFPMDGYRTCFASFSTISLSLTPKSSVSSSTCSNALFD